jgi:hypothetical protein
VAWIKQNTEHISPNQWRARYLNKLGIEKEDEEEESTEANLEKEEQFENDKYYINFFSQRTSQDIRYRYLSKLMIPAQHEQPERPRKKNQHSTFHPTQSSSSTGTTPSSAPPTSPPSSSLTLALKPRPSSTNSTSALTGCWPGRPRRARRSSSSPTLPRAGWSTAAKCKPCPTQPPPQDALRHR